MSMRSRVNDEKKKIEAQMPDWDRSTTTSKKGDGKQTVEDRVAAQIATEMLKENKKLRGIHSNVSMKKIIEKEAKR